jgi:hypothetical protein
VNFQDKQGHDDGEYAIAQRFDPVFADFEGCGVKFHGIYTARLDSTAPHPGQ